MYASPFFCLLAFAREIKKLCIVLYVAGGFRIKLSVSFVFNLERLSSDFVFTFSKLRNINYFHTCEVLFLKGRKLRSRECAFRDNNTHSVSGSNNIFAVSVFPRIYIPPIRDFASSGLASSSMTSRAIHQYISYNVTKK